MKSKNRKLKDLSKKIRCLESLANKLTVKINSIDARLIRKYSEHNVNTIIQKTIGGLREVVNLQNISIDVINKKLGKEIEVDIPLEFPSNIELEAVINGHN